MEWVKEFYTKQEAWMSLYTGEISDHHRQNVDKMVRLVGAPPLTVLELGAGGGQFAVAAADRGFHVTAIELIEKSAQHMKALAKEPRQGNLFTLQGDFYHVQLPCKYDAVCYWDGFGIGSDKDQRHLLQRIYQWLEPQGSAVVEIYTPWYWAQAAGREMSWGDTARATGFDALNCRMLDHWWPVADPSQKVTQSLRCYSPADLKMLLVDTGLVLETVEAGGAYDANTQTYIEKAPLHQAMTYVVQLRKS